MKYAWIQQHRDSFPIQTMCRMLGVSTSGYYKSRRAELGPRAARTQAIQADVQKVYEQSHGIYGSYKIARKLQEDARLESACRNTVAIPERVFSVKWADWWLGAHG